MKSMRVGWWLLWAIVLSGTAAQRTGAQIPGESWQRIGLLGGTIAAVGVSPSYGSDRTLFAAVQGAGLATSTDGGTTWAVLTAVPTNVTVTAIAFNPNWKLHGTESMWVGTDQGHVYTLVWNKTYSRYEVLYDFTLYRNGSVYAVSGLVVPVAGTYYRNVFAGTLGGGVFRSTDDGATFGSVSTTTTLDCRAIAAGPGGQILAAFYSGGKNPPVFTFLGEWSVRSTGLPQNCVPTALHIASSDAPSVWLGTADKGLWRSTDSAGTWVAACDGSTQTVAFSVGAVAACPNSKNDGEVWEGRTDGLFLSSNGAASCVLNGLYGSVTSITFAPQYHLTSVCDAFVGTTVGLFLKSCATGAPPAPSANRTPEVVPVDTLAMARQGDPDKMGIYAGSPGLGLLLGLYGMSFLQYNASGAFGNTVPDVSAVRLQYYYRVNGACGGDQQTVFVAERTLGVFRSQDDGNTWTQLDTNAQGASTWPANTLVNDLAVAPNYVTGATDREVLFAATSRGLYRWEGASTGWTRCSGDWVGNVTRVALPLTYDKRNAVGSEKNPLPYHLVLWASDTHVNADASVGGLYYSYDDGLSYPAFNAFRGVKDITSISFSPRYGVLYNSLTDWLAFVSRALPGTSPLNHVAFFASTTPLAGTPWCAFDSGLAVQAVRDLEVAPVYESGTYKLHLTAADADGPYYGTFDRTNNTDGCGSASYSWSPADIRVPVRCADSLAVAYAQQYNGQLVALGTPEDGVLLSADGGASYRYAGTGYGSLPDDVYNVLPHARDDRVVFASSPTYGVFVSRDKGASFRPWNAGGTGGPCVFASGWGLGMMPDRIAAGSDVVWAGMGSSGIKYRPITYDTTNGIQLDNDHWYDTTQSSGTFERFETLGSGQGSKARSTSPTLGFFFTAANDWYTWTAENGTLSALDAKSIRYGYDGLDTLPLASGATVADAVGQGFWKYYAFQVPYGTQDLRFFLDDPDDLGTIDPDMYIRYGALPTTSVFDYRPYINGDETVCVVPTAFTLLNETFEGTWGPYGNVPPAGWQILDYGDETTKSWNNNDWHKFAKGGTYGNVARVYYSPLENLNEWLLSPTFTIPSSALSVNLEFDHFFQEDTGSSVVQYGEVWYHSNQRGYVKIANYSATTADMAHVTLSLLAYRGDTGAQLLFRYTGYNGWQWQVDNIKVSGQSLSYGTWYVGVRGYAAGSSPYELTATLDSGCTGFAAPVAGEGKDPRASLVAERIPGPGPLAPASGSLWGTVSRSGSGGVFRGLDSTPLAGLSGEPAPAAVTWEARNGTGAGALSNLSTQCVLQLSDLSLIAGCNGGVFYSPAPDEGRTTWVDSTSEVVTPCSMNFTDLLLCSNGDVLIAANGTTDGGAWLSGDKGHHWMRISDGFDSTTQRLQDLVKDGGQTGAVAYYAGTESTGAYTRSITAMAYPTVTGLSSTGGTASGGETLTVTGTGFRNTCPTGDASDCPATGPVVLFDEVEATSTTFNSTTSLTCVVPPHPVGTAVVTVRNRDTRRGGARTYSFSCAAPSSLPAVAATDKNGCADEGVTVSWTADPGVWGDGNSGTRTYDVLRDGAAIASSLAYGTTSYTDTTGTNGTAYTYQVRYRGGCGLTTTSAGASATDFVTPGVPAITSIADVEACAQSGLRVYFTPGGGATQHALYRDGVQVVPNYKSGDTYNPGNTASHSYVVRALAGTTCSADSPASAGSDGNGTPGAPVLSTVSDNSAYALDGVRITFSAGSGASLHELWKDGVKVLDTYTSGALYTPGDTASHSYVVRAVNGSCVRDSSAVLGSDQRLVPPEISNGSFRWTSKTVLTWTALAGVPGYHVYRGNPDALAGLPTAGGAKACLDSGDWTTPPATVRSDTPTAGQFFWYLVTGHNDLGADGSAGSNRTLASTGTCSAP